MLPAKASSLRSGASSACTADMKTRFSSPISARDQEVALHEALDVEGAGAVGVAQPPRDLLLDIEGQAFLGPPQQVVQVRADGPQERLCLAEAPDFTCKQHPALFQLFQARRAPEVCCGPLG